MGEMGLSLLGTPWSNVACWLVSLLFLLFAPFVSPASVPVIILLQNR